MDPPIIKWNTPEDDLSWKSNPTLAFRKAAVTALAEAIAKSPKQLKNKTAVEVERNVCAKANNIRQYQEYMREVMAALEINVANQPGQVSGEGKMVPRHPIPQQQLPGGPNGPGMRMTQQQQQQQQQQMMMMQQQQQQQQRMQNRMMMPGMGQQPGMSQAGPGGVSQLQQRLTGTSVGNRMSQMPVGHGNMVQGGGGRMPGNMNMMQNRMMSHGGPPPNAMAPGMMGGASNMARGPPPMYGLQPSPHMQPGGSPGMGMIHSPATTGGQYIHSPASQPSLHSPAPQQPQHQRGMAPSPMSSANTPQNDPPGSVEDQEYLEKVRQLAKYIEPLKRMIAKIGNEDQSKLEKMKKLMDILSNPNKRMPMETLKKCEAVLKRMNFDVDNNSNSNLGSNQDTPSANPFLDAIAKASKQENNSIPVNHLVQKIIGEPLAAVYGTDISLPPLPKRKETDEEKENDDNNIPDILQGEVRRLQKHFKANLDPSQPMSEKTLTLICELEDPNLPGVPPISVTIPADYPDSSPIFQPDMCDYFSTPFLEKVQTALASRLMKMPFHYTLTQLLNAWEMSVRSACSPRTVKESQLSTIMGI